jgi:hypothetical protein
MDLIKLKVALKFSFDLFGMLVMCVLAITYAT